MTIRKLRADEIDCRIGQIKKDGSGLSLLLYKDARCDMNILDETFGSMNWKRRHTRDNANCIVSIWDADKKEWIDKEDTGTESNTEAEKGLASDSFKRACVNVGIGRELYTAPFIWITSDKCSIRDGKCYDKFTVTEIDYDAAGNINHLCIKNEKTGVRVFEMGVTPKPAKAAATKQEPSKQFLCEMCGNTWKPYTNKAGEEVSLRMHEEWSKANYRGRVYCPDCIRKMHEKKVSA